MVTPDGQETAKNSALDDADARYNLDNEKIKGTSISPKRAPTVHDALLADGEYGARSEIARQLSEIARQQSATAVANGATGVGRGATA